MPIVTGLLLGLSTLLFVGPVFFYLIQIGMQIGFKAGLSVAIGIILGDIICVFLAIYGVGEYLENETVQYWFAIIGGIILIILGLKSIFVQSKINLNITNITSTNYFKIAFNGFLINFVNPFVFAVWFGFYSILTNKYESFFDVNLALTFVLVTIFFTDILKALFAQKIKKFITPSFYSKFSKAIGLAMIFFGIRLWFSL